MIFNEEVFFDSKPTKITIELITALDEVIDLIEVQPALDFEDIQFWEDEEFITDILEDFIDIDGPEDDVEDNGLSNKLLNENFYFILPLSVHDYLDYIDFFIFIRFKGVGKGAIVVITAMPVTVETLLAATAEIVVILGKGVIAVIAVILVTVGTLLVVTAEIQSLVL